ncbi:MAG: aromatic ring-hydroxylating dioxygenase subunit alpha [Alphaproteobacteria bacterium]|nr:aromatic ring-hydroxylating dioxygenase subunit alpha [Alphaproteobacteria bacterium]
MAVSAARTQSELKFHPDPEHSSTLPGFYYFDPTIATHEREAIFLKSWQFVAYATDLAEVGSYVATFVLDQPVFIVRGKNGRVRAFYNACTHRGHTLVEGRGAKTIITCPFHAWSFDTSGALKAAGNAENVAGFKLDDFHLTEIRCEIWANMAFVNLGNDAAPMSAMYGGLAQEFRDAIPGFDDLKFGRRDQYDLNCNWKFVFDGLECYHCPHIHPQAMGTDQSFMTTTWDTYEYDSYSTHVVRTDRDVLKNHRERLPYPITEGDDVVDDYVWYMWPNYIFLAHPGPANFHVTHAVPTGPETAHRNVDHFFAESPPSAINIAQMNMHRDVIVPQDRAAMERQQLGVHSRGYRQGRLMVDQERSWRSEHGVHHFDKMVWETLNGKNY